MGKKSEAKELPWYGRGPIPVVALTTLLLAPFLDKAFHIDDALFLRAAEQIRKDPLHPYQFDYNWCGIPESMWKATQNPPLNSYLLAAVDLLAEGNEFFFHFGYLCLAISCVLLIFSLSKRWCHHPNLATILTLGSPAFLVSATNVMADIPLLFLWLLAIFLTVRSADSSRSSGLWWVGLVASAAAMTKYFGIALVPLLTVYWCCRSRRFSFHLLAFLLPPLTLALWGWYSKVQGGLIHPLASAQFSVHLPTTRIDQAADSLVFLGGTLLWPLFLFPLMIRMHRGLSIGAVGLAILTGVLCWNRVPAEIKPLWLGMEAGGVAVLAFGIASWRSRRDPESILLLFWLFGTVAFSLFFNWTVAARVILPAVFPAVLLVIRWIDSFEARTIWLRWISVAVFPTILLSFLLANVDHDFANAGRSFVESTVRPLKREGRAIWFEGHWGFQYYMEREGARPINLSGQNFRSGDPIVVPINNTGLAPLNLPLERTVDRPISNPYSMHTIEARSQAGFYSSIFGRVPFALSRSDILDRFVIERLRVAKAAPVK
jgi:hypothetical protein